MEGGIRTPAFILGGIVEDMLDGFGVTECEYNEMVHISDWYNIFTTVADITHNNADVDHDALEIWQDIQCTSLCLFMFI